MRLSDVLSKPCNAEFVPVDRVINSKISVGKQRKINIGKIGLNFFCEVCDDIRTFWSGDDLYCIGVNSNQISMDCILKCGCGTIVTVWYLVESYNNIDELSPEVRILKRREKLLKNVRLIGWQYDDFSELLDKAERAYRDGLGAGSIIYLRKIYENITVKFADIMSIQYKKYESGNPKNFYELLKKVDERCHIIPTEYSDNGYKLFRELSNIIHGAYDEKLGLKKFEALHRLIVGILDNVRNNKELNAAIKSLEWEVKTEVMSS